LGFLGLVLVALFATCVVCCVALRFDRLVKTKYPANVLSGFEAAAGATFFNLNELQVQHCPLHDDALTDSHDCMIKSQ
jgi:hypothetical protein